MKTPKEILENQDIVIFRTGKHIASDGSSVEYTEDDIDKIIKNTDLRKVANVIHHPKYTSYSLAEFASLQRKGKNLIARLKNSVEGFAEAVKAGLFPKRSVRFSNEKMEHLGWLPKGIEPAIKDMPDVQFSSSFFDFDMNNKDLDLFGEQKYMQEDNNSQKYVQEKGGLSMDKDFQKELMAKVATLDSEKKELTKKNEELEAKLKTQVSNLEKLQKEIQNNKEQAFSKAIESAIVDISTEDKKKKVKVGLEKISKGFDSVEDFQEALNLMSFEAKPKVELGARDFNSEFSDENKLAKDFEKMLEDEPEELEKMKIENIKKYTSMEKAWMEN